MECAPSASIQPPRLDALVSFAVWAGYTDLLRSAFEHQASRGLARDNLWPWFHTYFEECRRSNYPRVAMAEVLFADSTQRAICGEYEAMHPTVHYHDVITWAINWDCPVVYDMYADEERMPLMTPRTWTRRVQLRRPRKRILRCILAKIRGIHYLPLETRALCVMEALDFDLTTMTRFWLRLRLAMAGRRTAMTYLLRAVKATTRRLVRCAMAHISGRYISHPRRRFITSWRS
jgi:hypothetical protein